MKKNDFLLLSLLLLQFSSCGQNHKNDSVASLTRHTDKDQIIFEKNVTYLAVFHAINQQITGTITGALTIAKEDDSIVGDVRLSGSAPNIVHAQNIHVGTFCPNEYADLNLDKIIDIQEAQIFSGPILIPLDGDLNSQLDSYGIFPVSDPWGTYIYSEFASFKLLLEDLMAIDENDFDNVVKVREGAALNLIGKAVIIQGIADEVDLPSTVESIGLLTGHQTLPIACGIITKVLSLPGIAEDDDLTIGTIETPEAPNRLPSRPRNMETVNENNRRGPTQPMTPEVGTGPELIPVAVPALIPESAPQTCETNEKNC